MESHILMKLTISNATVSHYLLLHFEVATPWGSFSNSHWFVVHVDHRTMKRNLAGEDLGKTRLRNWRGGAWRRIQTRTCRGELGCGEEGPRYHRQNSCDSNPSNEQWSYLASEPKPIILLCRRDSKAVACEVLSCVSKMSLLENLQLTPYQNRLVPVM